MKKKQTNHELEKESFKLNLKYTGVLHAHLSVHHCLHNAHKGRKRISDPQGPGLWTYGCWKLNLGSLEGISALNSWAVTGRRWCQFQNINCHKYFLSSKWHQARLCARYCLLVTGCKHRGRTKWFRALGDTVHHGKEVTLHLRAGEEELECSAHLLFTQSGSHPMSLSWLVKYLWKEPQRHFKEQHSQVHSSSTWYPNYIILNNIPPQSPKFHVHP